RGGSGAGPGPGRLRRVLPERTARNLPNGEDSFQRPGQGRGSVGVAGIDLLEAIPRCPDIVAESQSCERATVGTDVGPTGGEQNCDDVGRVNQYLVGVAHTAALAGASRTATWRSSTTRAWSLVWASDSGVPPQRSIGSGLVPVANK